MTSLEETWQQMLIETVMLRDHDIFTRIQLVGKAARNPFVDMLAPRVMYVKMVALLDESLTTFVDGNGMTVDRPLRNDLNGRICCPDARGMLDKAGELHRSRGREP